MGITVLSAAILNPPGSGAASLLPADGAAGTDFAALLTQQMSGLPFLGVSLDSTARTGRESGGPPADAAEADSTGELDVGAFLAAAGLLPAAQAPQPPLHPGKAGQEGKDGGVGAPPGQIAGLTARTAPAAGKELDLENLTGGAGSGQHALLGEEPPRENAAIIAAEAKPETGGPANFAAALASQSAHAQRAAARHDGAGPTVGTPIHDANWSRDFGEKVVWLARNDQQVAQLNLNPPQLGPVQITLNLNGDQASALFVSPHAEVRQAIQDAMPQLREMLAGAGINLGQADVGTQLARQNSGEQPRFSESSRGKDDNAILRAESGQGSGVPQAAVRGGRGMVDLFA